MHTSDAYAIPAGTACAGQEIKRSRFIALLGHAAGREEAHCFITGAKDRWPGADHYCWAFVSGHPSTSADIGMSDDGEPQGTAGRPILNVLRHSGIGDIVAVVVRYFGGTRLGTGGLVRAYSGAVQKALEQLPLRECVPCQTVCLQAPFAEEDMLRRLITGKGFTLEDIGYAQKVEMTVTLPTVQMGDFCREVLERSRGRAAIVYTVDPNPMHRGRKEP